MTAIRVLVALAVIAYLTARHLNRRPQEHNQQTGRTTP